MLARFSYHVVVLSEKNLNYVSTMNNNGAVFIVILGNVRLWYIVSPSRFYQTLSNGSKFAKLSTHHHQYPVWHPATPKKKTWDQIDDRTFVCTMITCKVGGKELRQTREKAETIMS